MVIVLTLQSGWLIMYLTLLLLKFLLAGTYTTSNIQLNRLFWQFRIIINKVILWECILSLPNTTNITLSLCLVWLLFRLVTNRWWGCIDIKFNTVPRSRKNYFHFSNNVYCSICWLFNSIMIANTIIAYNKCCFSPFLSFLHFPLSNLPVELWLSYYFVDQMCPLVGW